MSLSSASIRTAPESATPSISELLDAVNRSVGDLLAACAPDNPLQSQVEQVQRSTDRLSLLATSSGTSIGPAKVRATALDLNSVVREMTAPLQRVLGPFINLETSLHLPNLWAAIERHQIEQVALGLVISAREALPLGGVVKLTSRRWLVEAPLQCRIGTLPAGVWSTLEVRDNGASVDERSIRHLLDPSIRGLPVDSTLSLSTVAAIVFAAGGHVVLDMPATGGTVLAACLPAVEPPRSRQPATGTANAIMVVDDDEWTRMSAARTLRHAGFGVLEAREPEDALELLDDVAGSCVRLMVVDSRMLAAGNQPLGERIRRERPEVDVVVTGTHRSSTGSGDANAILTKPFTADDLLAAVRNRLNG